MILDKTRTALAFLFAVSWLCLGQAQVLIAQVIPTLPEVPVVAVTAKPTCAEKLTGVVSQLYHPESEYLGILAPLVCKEGEEHGIDPLKIAAIISNESGWVKQEKGSNGNYGPMQVNWIHAKSRGLKREALLDPKTNVEIGTDVFLSCKQDFGCYNGYVLNKATGKYALDKDGSKLTSTPGYVGKVKKTLAKLKQVWKELYGE